MRKPLAVLLFFVLVVGTLPVGAQQTGGDELPFSREMGDGYTLSWRILPDAVEFEMSAPTEGWVAVGFEPVAVMDQADMVFGWVTDAGDVVTVDAFSTGMFGPHPPDEELGGTSDVTVVEAGEEGGRTTIRFVRPLDTGDEYDKPIPEQGTLNLIWAYGDRDDFSAMHVAAGYGAIEMQGGESDAAGGGRSSVGFLLLLHAVLLSLGFLCMLTGLVVARYFKKKKWWLKVHKPLGIVGALSSVTGIIAGVAMVALTTGRHIRVLHAAFGLLTIVLAVGTPFLGYAIFRRSGDRKMFRTMHRWYGRVTILLMAVTILLGLRQAGII